MPGGALQRVPERAVLRHTPIDGAFTNFVSINEDFAFALPDSLSDNASALMEPLSVGI